ncbi:MAG: ABC transporter ATP-binding protein [Azoarcus sp.]|jgi:NitT/TauT family transport system ATP-binding protein|nr:ABC transporter ATP-binding protein [Azoarcus sp.]
MSRRIRFAGVSKAYAQRAGGNRDVLRDFDFEIAAGELVAFVGPSGVGKSTLLHLAAQLDVPDRGAVTIGADGEYPGRLGIVFQQPRLLDWLTVRQNLELVLDGHDDARIDELLAIVEMKDFVDAWPRTLSGGQRQRVALARAFAVKPEVLLLDEPFSALDELTGRRLRLLLQQLWLKGRPPTGILVTHNMQEAAFLADRIVILQGHPARAVDVIDVDLPRPRSPEDECIFHIHRRVIACLSGFSQTNRLEGVS